MSSHITTIPLTPKKDFLDRLSSTNPLSAITELIWNGLDAGSDRIDVTLFQNPLSGIDRIVVKDMGFGIFHPHVPSLFGNLGDSWKKTGKGYKGRSLHGKNGAGRLKAFTLGHHVEWNTTYENDGKNYSYSISGRFNALDKQHFSEPIEIKKSATGTEVVITDIQDKLGQLLEENAAEILTKNFALYLSKYSGVDIYYNGELLDPQAYQLACENLPSVDVTLADGTKSKVDVTVIEWRVKTPKVMHLCDASGVALHEIPGGVKAPGFNYTAYVKSARLRELDSDNVLLLDDLHPDQQVIVDAAKGGMRDYFRKRKAETYVKTVDRWKQEHIYPYQDNEELSSVELVERQVFDILAVNVETYLPKFEDVDNKGKKFMFMLISQALKQNPESVQTIITEVLNLNKEEQDDLAELINSTSLPSIIKTAKIITNRLNFLQGLENLVCDPDTKKSLLERDQLHKILDSETWIFDEDFNLAGSEERLEEVLEKHTGLLGEREDGETSVEVGDGKTGRIDLRLSKTVQPRNGEHDYLVVELKRPSKKIDDQVITQTKKYAMAVAGDDRFQGVPAKWKFLAVSTSMNDYAKSDANQPNRPSGMVWESPDKTITVWVKEWGEVINSARARLEFMREQLNFEASRDSSKEYLSKTHSKFIPDSVNDEKKDAAKSGVSQVKFVENPTTGVKGEALLTTK